MPNHSLLSLTSVLLLVSGCALGPDYHTPSEQELSFQIPERFQETDPETAFERHEQDFWQGFEDPFLADLIQQTLTANRTLEAGMARYERAAALLRIARSDRLPNLSANARASEQYPAQAELGTTGVAGERRELYQAGVTARWELDLFGRLRRSAEVRRAQFNAAGADLEALQVALVGQLASSYFELRGLQQQLAIARENIENQRQTLAIVSSRLDAGQGTDFDQVRAQAQLDAIRAAVPELEAAIHTRMHRIAVLTGQAPAALISTLDRVVPLPQSTPEIPVGSPGDALRRRPDIRAAEQRLAAATAGIGIATADLFPRFSLDALMGSVATDSSDLFSRDAESRSVALGVDWTFLDFGGNRARIAAANADTRAALAEYEQTVLDALEETETFLVRYHRSQTRTQWLSQSTQAATRAVELARDRYRQGYNGYFEVLDAERELIRTRDALIESRTGETLAMVNIYRALAGAPVSARNSVD